ncbi:MAG: hypothetical protein E7030_09270 [Akkermansiaceae bacterium]|nr:hypothetical protein [Akkermansiaceae bacterium]
MAGVIERSEKWYATFRINGTTKRVNTGVPIEQKGRKPSQLEAEARQKAVILEQRAKGLLNHSSALDALRSVERINGGGGMIPTVREYLTNYKGQATAKTEKNKKRAAKMFFSPPFLCQKFSKIALDFGELSCYKKSPVGNIAV